ncbi:MULTISPECIES: L-histidine N(alpha)-methyltransferase [Methylorubrum]|uniref:Dimethylhistidine N-methyltransferase n=1 Tax=Methylorubrum thiocyanatum TaxID=47958 RepID=A0AA40S1W6_9HYPH|nr:L-histidine N(alpha)-methyltransferase [Methylorubrum thiocyanatum]MBA8913044.1 dimethylhistidine N-methyltransferase [Methylorubrum thiocyanatum]GJE83781.1 Histidine N-alpha-methyltransferase [Methylorubrum thiocyanatum]
MTIDPRLTDSSPAAPITENGLFLADVWDGLGASPKALPAKYFYDAAGSALFEEITVLPEYYPTRTELGILDARGPAIAALLPEGAALVEFGSGSTAKLRRLLRHLPGLSAYLPVDVSGEFLREQAETLRGDFPGLAVEPVVADFTRPFALPPGYGDRALAGFFPGSTIGNFEPNEAARLLDVFGRILGTGATLVLGVDLVKDRAVLEAAYDDAAGVTAAFNLNLLHRINRELDGAIDPDSFAHRAVFNEAASRIEMHLVSRRAQTVRVAGRSFSFREGESIHTENSYKYTLDGFRALAARAGWASVEAWTDADGLFSVHALRREA